MYIVFFPYSINFLYYFFNVFRYFRTFIILFETLDRLTFDYWKLSLFGVLFLDMGD